MNPKKVGEVLMSGKYEGGTAVYDVIRDTLRDGCPRTVAALAAITGYSEGYVRLWLRRMSDVKALGPELGSRASRFQISGGGTTIRHVTKPIPGSEGATTHNYARKWPTSQARPTATANRASQ